MSKQLTTLPDTQHVTGHIIATHTAGRHAETAVHAATYGMALRAQARSAAAAHNGDKATAVTEHAEARSLLTQIPEDHLWGLASRHNDAAAHLADITSPDDLIDHLLATRR